MDQIDPQKAARVWQRVTGVNIPSHKQDPLAELIALEQQAIALCLTLANSGTHTPYFRRLAQRKQEQCKYFMQLLSRQRKP